MIRRESAEWSWVKSEEGAEGYIFASRLLERNLQSAIFNSVAERASGFFSFYTS
jgi:hypothetical protein